jgi:hypothetical protein
MRLSQLLSLILAKTLLTVEVPEEIDVQLNGPDDPAISLTLEETEEDIVLEACKNAGLTDTGAYAFSLFFYELVTGIPTLNWAVAIIHVFSDRLKAGEISAIIQYAAYASALYERFCIVAFGDPNMSFSLDDLSSWNDLFKHISDIQRGVAAAFEDAKQLF